MPIQRSDSSSPTLSRANCSPAPIGSARLRASPRRSPHSRAIGYSGKPIRVLIGLDAGGRIVAAKLVEQHEPIVLIGIPAAKLTAFIRGYVGRTIGEAPEQPSAGLPADIISGATVTTMVIGDSITRSAIRVAQSR